MRFEVILPSALPFLNNPSLCLSKLPNSLESPRSWHAQGPIKTERTCSGVHLYDINHVLSNPTNTSTPLSAFITPTDITKGINWKRSGRKTLLERLRRGLVSEVCFTLSDSFCLFYCLKMFEVFLLGIKNLYK
jgi:hypothetical protein